MNIFQDYFFWFAQPSTVLSGFDLAVGYTSAGLVVASVVLWAVNRFLNHTILKRLISKFSRFGFGAGSIGLVWFALRYENTPIFAKRFWLFLMALVALIWLGFILNYLLRRFGPEKSEYDRYQVNSKYMPGKK